MAQKDRKIQKKRGTRGCGYGNAKKHRGAGSRGGRGNAGSGKHKQIKGIMEGKTFGKSGFKRHPSLVKKANTLNLAKIERMFDSWVADGRIKKEGSDFVLDVTALGYDKVLGSGSLTRKIKIESPSFSASAKEKIEKAGGKAVGEAAGEAAGGTEAGEAEKRPSEAPEEPAEGSAEA